MAHPASLAKARVTARRTGRTLNLRGGERAAASPADFAAVLTSADQRAWKLTLSPLRVIVLSSGIAERTRSPRYAGDEPPNLDDVPGSLSKGTLPDSCPQWLCCSLAKGVPRTLGKGGLGPLREKRDDSETPFGVNGAWNFENENHARVSYITINSDLIQPFYLIRTNRNRLFVVVL